MRKTGVWEITDGCLQVEYLEEKDLIMVRDTRAGKSWHFDAPDPEYHIQEVRRTDKGLKIRKQGKILLNITLEVENDCELIFRISSDNNAIMDRLEYPAPIKTPDRRHYLVQTDGEGLLLPADDTGYILEEQPVYFCGGGPAMAWMGVVDGRMEAGYMAIFETPYDLAVRTEKREGLITFSPVWLAQKGEFGYERKIRYVFFDRGGYVAQCKRYREYIWPVNRVQTLRERQERFPALEKMLGAVHIYVWDQARTVEFAKKLKEAGVEKALILWNPNHRPYPEPGFDDELRALGYGTGSYELFTDIRPKEKEPDPEFLKRVPLVRNVYSGKYESITSRKRDGSVYSNRYGVYVCPRAVRPEMAARVERELKDYRHETLFLDVYQANGLYECYSSDHPLTRSGYAEAIRENCRFLEDQYHLYLGGEFGADFAAEYGAYVHGMMTLQRMWWKSDIEKAGTIYYIGDWKNGERPSIMLGARTATEEYLRYSINETLRVPLYELVYHDAVVTSWRWEDCNHHYPELWWKKDMFNILYGSAPLWSVDQDRWEAYRETFVESYGKICSWLSQICYDEMVDHRFLTADRRVQESCFSSGKRVVVNFSEIPYETDGRTVPAGDFQIMS